jgi:hypothetical protein
MCDQDFDGAVEFLFMDGSSEDATRAILDELAAEDARIRVIDNPGRGIPQGLNVGLQHARGDYVARMDAHTHYPRTYLARGIERLRSGDVAWVAGAPIPAGGGKWSRRVSVALGSPLGVGGSPKWVAVGETELDTGVFGGVWHRTTLEQLRGWDEEWAVNEDSELAARFRAECEDREAPPREPATLALAAAGAAAGGSRRSGGAASGAPRGAGRDRHVWSDSAGGERARQGRQRGGPRIAAGRIRGHALLLGRGLPRRIRPLRPSPGRDPPNLLPIAATLGRAQGRPIRSLTGGTRRNFAFRRTGRAVSIGGRMADH